MFIASMVFTAIMGSVLGGALTWKNTRLTPRQTVAVGKLGFNLTYDRYPDAVIGPNNGVPVPIGHGTVTNTGSMNLTFQSGWIDILGVLNYSQAACRSYTFVGSVVPVIAGQGIRPGSTEGLYVARIAMLPEAAKACQGKTLSYRVAVTVAASPGN